MLSDDSSSIRASRCNVAALAPRKGALGQAEGVAVRFDLFVVSVALATLANSTLAADLRVLQRELDLLHSAPAEAQASGPLSPDERRQRLREHAAAIRTAIEGNQRVIIVNIPAYTLTAYEDGQPVLRSRVIVGAVDRRTPQLETEVAGVQLNPAWSAPPRVVKGDLTRKGNIDERAVRKKGLSVYDEKGKPLPPEVLSFVPPEQQGRLRFYQPPGDQNALGRVKIVLAGVPDIYLHDTPNKSLFGKTKRALSSGCVRVEQARELAAWLTGKSPAELDGLIGTGKTRTLVAQPAKVMFGYWLSDTAEQRVVFPDDIYRLAGRRKPDSSEATSLAAAVGAPAPLPDSVTGVTAAAIPPAAVEPVAAPARVAAPAPRQAADPAPLASAYRRAVITPASAPPWFGSYVRSALAGLELRELAVAVGARLPPTSTPPTMMLAIDRYGYVRAADYDQNLAAPGLRAMVQRHFERHRRTLPLPQSLGPDLDEVVVPVALAAAPMY